MRVLQLGTVAAVPWSVRLMIPGVAWSLSRWILFGVRGRGFRLALLSMIQAVNRCGGAVVGLPGVRGRGFVIKDSGTVAAVLSMIQAVNRCGFSSWEPLRRGRGGFCRPFKSKL